MSELTVMMDIAERLPARVKDRIMGQFGEMKEGLEATRKWVGEEEEEKEAYGGDQYGEGEENGS